MRDVLHDKQLDQVEEIVDFSIPSVEFKCFAATSNLDVSITIPLSKSSDKLITSNTGNLPIQNEQQRNKDNDHVNVIQDFLSHQHKQAAT